MNKQRITVSWSGGKDSAYALYQILLSEQYEVVSLHTVIGKETQRVGLHGIREELIEQQANALNLPLHKLYLETSDEHKAYENLVRSFYAQAARQGIDAVLFGDIFLEDLKQYREKLLEGTGLFSLYPLWKKDTRELVEGFIQAGFKTLICAARSDLFSQDYIGNTIDLAFLERLPKGVDFCGENGEFHTFVYDGPIFQSPLEYQKAGVISKSYNYQKKLEDGTIEKLESSFWFQDLLPLIAS